MTPKALQIAERAAADLEEIREYIRGDDPAAAERIRVHLLQRMRLLCRFPFAGVTTRAPRIRVLQPTRYPYRIYYAVLEDAIRILHVRHTSRLLPDLERF